VSGHDIQVADVADIAGTEGFAAQAHAIYSDLVANGAAIGWLEPPSPGDVADLLARVALACASGDAAIRGAYDGGRLVGLGYWKRYSRPSHRVNADVERFAVDRRYQRRGTGRALLTSLVAAARAANIETLTLDVRADNQPALSLYESAGFFQYGRLKNFVAFGDRRYDKVFMALELAAGRG
jgi:ribosomal protein S18 acetylase RimI-like enzyme